MRRSPTVSETITGVTALGALVFTGLSLNATRDQVVVAQQQNKVSEQGQYTDRYAKSVAQLDQSGPEHLQGRLGGIYALERLAHDSPRDQPTIVEILSAFARTNRPTATFSREGWPTCPSPQPLTPDTQAALAVLSRRDHTRDNATIVDLSHSCLNDVTLNGIDLSGANLSYANLNGANLRRANLNGANLRGADLTGTDLNNADLNHATLSPVNLSGAHLLAAELRDAQLSSANLSYANLSDANLRRANLRDAYLNDSDLSGADLRDTQHNQATEVERVRSNRTTAGVWW